MHKSTGQTGSDGNNPSTAPTHLHPAPSRKQHSALKAKALEGEGPFSNHCRSFDTHMKVSKCFELSLIIIVMDDVYKIVMGL